MSSLDDLECPYCGEDFEVNTDDGTHFSDDESEADYCPNCDKQIMIYCIVQLVSRSKQG